MIPIIKTLSLYTLILTINTYFPELSIMAIFKNMYLETKILFFFNGEIETNCKK